MPGAGAAGGGLRTPAIANAVLMLIKGSIRTAGLGRSVAGPFLFGLGRAIAARELLFAAAFHKGAGTASAVWAKIAPAAMTDAPLEERKFPSATFVPPYGGCLPPKLL